MYEIRDEVGYHNHDFEFTQKFNDKKVFDIMLEKMDPKLVVVQLDIGNMYNAGAVALEVVKQFPGRFENIHVKDEIKSTGDEAPYESSFLERALSVAERLLILQQKSAEPSAILLNRSRTRIKCPLIA